MGDHIQFFREAGSQLAIALACIIGAGYWLLAPQADRWLQETAECREIEAAKAEALHVTEVSNRIQSIAQQVTEIEKCGNASSDSAQLYDSILQCSREASVDLGRISPGVNNNQKTGPSLFSVHVNSTGSYENIVTFFTKLQQLPTLHQIRQWQIRSRESTKGEHLVTADIDIQFAIITIPDQVKDILKKVVQ